MLSIDKTLNKAELELLRKLIGQKLNSIEGAFRFDNSDAWNTLRINAENIRLDINLRLEGLPVDEGDENIVDDTGVFSVDIASAGPLKVDPVPLDIKAVQINEKVECVKIFVSEIKYYEDNVQYYQNNIAKAIAFKLNGNLDEKWLVLDRKVWFDEAITVTFCENVMLGIRDDSQDWQNGSDECDDDSLTMEYKLVEYEL